MYTRTKAYIGIDNSREIFKEITEIIFGENSEDGTIEVWNLPTESFSEHHPAFSNFYEVELEGNNDEDEEPMYQIDRKKILSVRPVNWNDMMGIAFDYLSKRMDSNEKESMGKICDIDEADRTIETNTMKNAAALRIADYAIAANTADNAFADNFGWGCITASTGDYTTAVVRAGSTAVNTGFGCTTVSRAKHSMAVSWGNESMSICCGDTPEHFDEDGNAFLEDMGKGSVAVCNGENSVAIVNGSKTVAITVGDSSLSECTGNSSISIALGNNSVAYAADPESSAYATANCKWAKGKIGSALHFDERTADGKLLHTAAVIVDGEKIKEDVLYTLKNGVVVKV